MYRCSFGFGTAEVLLKGENNSENGDKVKRRQPSTDFGVIAVCVSP